MSYYGNAATVSQRAYTYKVTVPPATLPVTLVQVKEQLRLDPIDTSQDDLLTLYIGAATDYAEKFTRRDFITRTYETFRDFFPGSLSLSGYYYPYPYYFISGNVGFEIRRSELQTIEMIEYLVDGSLVTVDNTTYYNTLQEDYSVVLTKRDQLWPSDADFQLQAITITFKCGYGDTETDVPIDIQLAILQIVTALYENRGDCSDSLCASASCAKFAPATALAILKQNRIENL